MTVWELGLDLWDLLHEVYVCNLYFIPLSGHIIG